MMSEAFYVTAAIPYVNAAPHLGHALELVQADALARHRRLRGQPVRFLTGTDDNALKNVTAAAAAGLATAVFVAANSDRFASLRELLNLSNDDFIATSADPRHAPGVGRLWHQSAARGDFYRRRYEGRYCQGCEQFYEASDLVGERCPEHGTVPERVSETNWFFRLSRYADRIREELESGRVRIEPATRRNEVLAFVRSGLRDISVSRPASRASGWGIPVPGDPEQVVYVWWDALANYVTALGYASDDEAYHSWWLRARERVHVIGKGIVRFHAVYWLGLLLSAAQPLPSAILVHEYLTAGGAKISKSAGTAVEPVDLVGRYGVDALRWWLLRGGPHGRHRLQRGAAGGPLPPGSGQRVGHRASHPVHGASVSRRRGRPGALPPGHGADLVAATHPGPGACRPVLVELRLRGALDAVWSVVDAANRLVEVERPWELARDVTRSRSGASTWSSPRSCTPAGGWPGSFRRSFRPAPPG
jgi:methionyl-tRNA synthetase